MLHRMIEKMINEKILPEQRRIVAKLPTDALAEIEGWLEPLRPPENASH